MRCCAVRRVRAQQPVHITTAHGSRCHEAKASPRLGLQAGAACTLHTLTGTGRATHAPLLTRMSMPPIFSMFLYRSLDLINVKQVGDDTIALRGAA